MKMRAMLENRKKTLLLLHFNGDFNDATGNFVLNNTGAVINTSNYKFGTGGAYFHNGLLIFPDKSWFSELLASGNYTIDFWLKRSFNWSPSGLDNEECFSDDYTRDTQGYMINFQVESSGTNFIMYGNYEKWMIYNFKNYFKQGDWNHIAVTSENNYHRFFINGNMIDSKQNYSPYLRTHNLCIGGRQGEGQATEGYYDEFRISNVARWTSNFTPPTEQYKVD